VERSEPLRRGARRARACSDVPIYLFLPATSRDAAADIFLFLPCEFPAL